MNTYDPSDEDKITCEHCGHSEYPDVGAGFHTCPEGAEASRRETEQFNQNFFGSSDPAHLQNPTKRVVQVTLTIEAPPTVPAMQSAVSEFTAFPLDELLTSCLSDPGTQHTMSHHDEILHWRYTARVTCLPIAPNKPATPTTPTNPMTGTPNKPDEPSK